VCNLSFKSVEGQAKTIGGSFALWYGLSMNSFTQFLKSFWASYLLFVLLMTAALIVPQKGALFIGMPQDSLLTIQLVPYMCGLFLLGSALFILSAAFKTEWLSTAARLLSFIGAALAGAVVFTTVWETHQVLEIGHFGMSNLYEVSILLLAVTSSFGLWFESKKQFKGFALFLAPLWVLQVLFIIWLMSINQAGHRELLPALQSQWLPWHVLANFIGYGCFFVAASAGVMQLMRSRADKLGAKSNLPTVEACTDLHYRAILIGFPVFSLAILLGCVWAYEAWGGYWSWDPKETWALIVWLIYGGYLHARYTHFARGNVLAWWTIVAFAATLFCYLGVNMFLDGMHSYGQLG